MSARFPKRRFHLFAISMRCCVGLTAVFCCSIFGAAWAAEGNYSSISPDQHLKEWLLLGPIPAQEANDTADVDKARKQGFEQDLLEKAGGEAKISPKSGNKVTARGKEYAWRAHENKDDIIDLVEIFGAKDFAVAYAAATIESPEAETRIVGLGSDDAVRVWLNGELVHENAAPRAVAIDDDVFPVKLKKGTNRLLIKVVNDQGDWGYSFRFLSPESLAKRFVPGGVSRQVGHGRRALVAGGRRRCQVARRNHGGTDRQGARPRSSGRLLGFKRSRFTAAVRCCGRGIVNT